MSIWNLLSWQQKEDIEEAVKELEEAVSKFRYSKVYTEDIDYFFYINISLHHGVVCSIYYEWLEGDDRPTLHTRIGNFHEPQYEMREAVKNIIDHLDYLDYENSIGGDSK
ncbi:hypothetical protein [Burkholderia cenocepacia]|uniref:hypothetical protein n=1 Tax=Burkholderia cenocepacia TaxID=95486 RepID=UPI001177EA2D|nr:hypothetical protein [Burkholderia cenocepacia]